MKLVATYSQTPPRVLCSVDRASLYNLVNETNLVHGLFLVYFVNFTYKLYIFRTYDCQVCRSICFCTPGSHKSEKYAPAYQIVSYTE